MLLSNFKLIASTVLSIIACVAASPVPRDQGQILIGYRIANPVRMLCFFFTDTDNSTDFILCCRNKVPSTIVLTLSLPIKMKMVCRLAQALTPLPNLGNGLLALVISLWLHSAPPEWSLAANELSGTALSGPSLRHGMRSRRFGSRNMTAVGRNYGETGQIGWTDTSRTRTHRLTQRRLSGFPSLMALSISVSWWSRLDWQMQKVAVWVSKLSVFPTSMTFQLKQKSSISGPTLKGASILRHVNSAFFISSCFHHDFTCFMIDILTYLTWFWLA